MSSASQSKTDLDITYNGWLQKHFPHVITHPFAPRHQRLWSWFDDLEPGKRISPRVEVWPRGGAKSSTAELGVAYIANKLSRRYVLYVSETQDQADKHVGAIATLLERAGLARSLNKYGSSKGWRRNQLRTENGFNVESLGLDTAARGIKLDEFRPDLIIFDDIDNQEDNRKATEKKIRAITSSILPAGSSDCCSLFIQNLIIEDGVVSRLVDGRADFLLDRDVAPIEPAIRGLVTERYYRSDGRAMYRIVEGEATWDGQSKATCQAQILEWGLSSFLREAQQEVKGADGVFFKPNDIAVVDETPELEEIAIAFDIGATEGGGDYTVGVAVGREKNDVVHVLDLIRGQWGADGYEERIVEFCKTIKFAFGARSKKLKIRIPQDPGAAGKLWADKMVHRIKKAGFTSVESYPVTKKKAIRARTWQSKVNDGNSRMRRAEWNSDFRQEHKDFKEDESHEHDDQVDAASDAVNAMVFPGGWMDDPDILKRLADPANKPT